MVTTEYLPPAQKRALEAVVRMRAASGVAPTLQELADALLVSKVTVLGSLRELERKEYLKRFRYKARSIEVLKLPGKGVPCPQCKGCGFVEAES